MSMQGAVIILAEGHAATGSADNRQLGLELLILRQRLLQGRDHHVRSAMEPVTAPALWPIC